MALGKKVKLMRQPPGGSPVSNNLGSRAAKKSVAYGDYYQGAKNSVTEDEDELREGRKRKYSKSVLRRRLKKLGSRSY
jgi:NADP-dependent 3-hydroxy acid dehydrogenase YdfG